jgi:hypothetical protein
LRRAVVALDGGAFAHRPHFLPGDADSHRNTWNGGCAFLSRLAEKIGKSDILAALLLVMIGAVMLKGVFRAQFSTSGALSAV